MCWWSITEHRLTIPGSKVLAGHVGNVTIQSCPSHLTVAGPGGRCLRARATIVTAHLAAQVHKVLHAINKTGNIIQTYVRHSIQPRPVLFTRPRNTLPGSSAHCIQWGRYSGRCLGRQCRCLHTYKAGSRTHSAQTHRTSHKNQDGSDKKRCWCHQYMCHYSDRSCKEREREIHDLMCMRQGQCIIEKEVTPIQVMKECYWTDYSLPLSTFLNIVFTQDSIKARSAVTHKAIDVILAEGSVAARLAGTLIHLSLTSLPFKTWAALTGETVNVIHTRASIQAGVCRGGKSHEGLFFFFHENIFNANCRREMRKWSKVHMFYRVDPVSNYGQRKISKTDSDSLGALSLFDHL